MGSNSVNGALVSSPTGSCPTMLLSSITKDSPLGSLAFSLPLIRSYQDLETNCFASSEQSLEIDGCFHHAVSPGGEQPSSW